MSTNRVIGGLLALAGGGLVLASAIMATTGVFANLPVWGPELSDLYIWIVSLLFGILGVIGGIIALAGRSGGLALVIGLVMVLTTVLIELNLIVSLGVYIGHYSLFAQYIYVIPYVTFEGILVLVGGLVALPGGE